MNENQKDKTFKYQAFEIPVYKKGIYAGTRSIGFQIGSNQSHELKAVIQLQNIFGGKTEMGLKLKWRAGGL